MLGWLASLFSGPIINGLLDAYRAKLDAANNVDAHAVDLAKAQIAADMQAKSAAKEIRLATSGFPEVRFLFFLLGVGFVLHAFAICAGTLAVPFVEPSHWLRHIPALPAPFDEYEGQIVGFFFGSAVAMTGIQAIAAGLARRMK